MARPPQSKRAKNSPAKAQKKKPARVGDTHVINYEPETQRTIQIKREHRTRVGFKVGAVLVILAGLVALFRATFNEALIKNPRFSLRQIVVTTEGSLTPQKIVKTTGLTEGQNLLTTNLREVRERIERLPEVRSVTVRRDYDGTLTIDVVQRHPVAWLECQKLRIFHMKSGSGCLVDAEGVALPCDVLIKEYLRLPVIHIEELGQVNFGAPVQSPPMMSALKLLVEFGRRFDDDQDEIESIEIANRYALEARFRNGVEVTFGCDDLDLQLVRYDQIKQKARERQWDIATLNLLAQENIPITFRRNPASLTPRAADSAAPRRPRNAPN